MQRRRAKKNPLNWARDPRHGTPGGYRNYGCRCDRCKAAAAADVKKYMTLDSVTVHGAQGYRRGCRCDICRRADHARLREHRVKKAEWKKNHRTHGSAGAVILKNLK